MKRFLQEPLVHFVLFAGMIFMVYGLINQSRQSDERTIVVSSAEIERLAALYAVEAGNLPSEQDLQAMVTDHVRQQALAREARKLGMAEGDTVVERRLAQKMMFMISDLGEIDLPSEKELARWFLDNRDRFADPARLSFQHIYFADAGDTRIEELSVRLATGDSVDWRRLGDPFMLQRTYNDLPALEVTRLFGKEFSQQLSGMTADPVRWQGPIQSAFGTHFVQISQRTERRLPELQEVREAVEIAWREKAQRARTARELQTIVDQYKVVIESGEER